MRKKLYSDIRLLMVIDIETIIVEQKPQGREEKLKVKVILEFFDYERILCLNNPKRERKLFSRNSLDENFKHKSFVFSCTRIDVEKRAKNNIIMRHYINLCATKSHCDRKLEVMSLGKMNISVYYPSRNIFAIVEDKKSREVKILY